MRKESKMEDNYRIPEEEPGKTEETSAEETVAESGNTEGTDKIKDETVCDGADTVTEEETPDDAPGQDDDADGGKMSRSDRKKLKKLESEIASLNKTIETKNSELAAANDKYMRLFAEYDNFRKRTAKEREGIYTDAYADALVQILPVLDNLERAAAFAEGESIDAANLAKGLELTLKSFGETLGKMGVTEIEALGKTFDPNLHNAVMHVEDDSLGENEIIEVFMKGYVKGDKVLRHSMVKVAN